MTCQKTQTTAPIFFRLIVQRKKQHGMRHTATYHSWADMRQRCTNPKNSAYGNYGARGIAVYEPWADFRNFYADIGVKPDGLTLERLRVNEGYKPDNCIWATYETQARNKRINVLNKSGIEGVWWDEKKSRYVVKLNVADRVRHFGTYMDFFEACCARRSAENIYRN